MTSDQQIRPMLLSAQPASREQRRVALSVVLVLLVAFVATLPFAQIKWVRFPGAILIQNPLLFANDLFTATMLFGQYRVGRTPALALLAGGYVFTALMGIAHTLSFPGVLAPSGLLEGGPETTPWLYVAWHTVLPLAVIAYALRGPEDEARWWTGDPRRAIAFTVVGAVGLAVAATALTTLGHGFLPALVEDGRLMPASRIVVAALLLPPLGAVATLVRRRDRSVLDVWLMVVMSAWLCTTALVAFVSSERFDIGWYMGRVFEVLTSVVVLLVLLLQTIGLYERNMRAVSDERRSRERRLNEMEAVLIHLSRVSELGQNVSSLVHEVNQPLAALSNYLAAGIKMIDSDNTGALKPVLERGAEQAVRATEIIRHLRDFIVRRESEKRIEDLRDVFADAVRLAQVGVASEAPSIDISCDPTAAVAFIDRVQIEQVVFNLVRNAVEAMAGSPRREVTIAASLNPANMVEISIADTGPGLPQAVRAKLFEPFVTSKPRGLGIGLSICRVIVEAHGGQLEAHDNPGGGTVFRFTLEPAVAVADPPDIALSRSRAPRRGRRSVRADLFAPR